MGAALGKDSRERFRAFAYTNRVPSRNVFQAEALAWLAANPAPPRAGVVTSLPDVSELPGVSFEAWRVWFMEAARAVLRWTPRGGCAIFFQSDIRHHGAWIDKGYLVQRAAESVDTVETPATLLWHRIVCRKPPGLRSLGRPTYSHMLCYFRGDARTAQQRIARAEVLPDAGFMSWSKAMGTDACRLACEYLRDEANTRVIVDPFCGRGTVLSVANELGLDAIGVDLSSRCCSAARRGVRIPPA